MAAKKTAVVDIKITGQDSIQELERELGDFGRIATISGRYYAMDRDNNFDRIEKYYDAIVNNKGEHFNSSIELIENSYLVLIMQKLIYLFHGLCFKDCSLI